MTLTIRRAATVLVTAGAIAACLTVAGSAADAATVPLAAAGTTTIQFDRQALQALQTDGCGVLTGRSTGGGSLVTTAAGKIRLLFPLTGVLVNPVTGHGRLIHAGSGVELRNGCYDLRLTDLYIEDLGQGMTEVLDVVARVRTPDTAVRTMVFTLDLTSAKPVTKDNGALKVRSIDVVLSGDGANRFNALATDNAPDGAGNVAGPFTAGEQIGKGRIFYRVQPPAA